MSGYGAILLAAGRSARMGVDKLWAELYGRPVLAYSLEMLSSLDLDALVLVVAEPEFDRAQSLVAQLGSPARVCLGGERRRDSVAKGLTCLGECEWVIVHDAARPLATTALALRGLQVAQATGAAVPGVPLADTVKRVGHERVLETLSREGLWRTQTPQVFRRQLLLSALASCDDDVGDEATLVERLGGEVRVFPGNEDNIKLTTPGDLLLAEALLAARERRQVQAVGTGPTAGPQRGQG